MNRRKDRQDVTRFKGLIATPVTGAVIFPANARVRLRSVAGCAAGTVAATLTGPAVRTLATPLLAAGGSVTVDKVAVDTTLTPSVGFQVLIDTGLGKFRQIASA